MRESFKLLQDDIEESIDGGDECYPMDCKLSDWVNRIETIISRNKIDRHAIMRHVNALYLELPASIADINRGIIVKLLDEIDLANHQPRE